MRVVTNPMVLLPLSKNKQGATHGTINPVDKYINLVKKMIQ